MLGVKSAQTPHTMGIKLNRTPHTLGNKTHMVLKNNSQNQSAYVDNSHVVDNKNLSDYEPIGPGVKPYKGIKNKSRLER